MSTSFRQLYGNVCNCLVSGTSGDLMFVMNQAFPATGLISFPHSALTCPAQSRCSRSFLASLLELLRIQIQKPMGNHGLHRFAVRPRGFAAPGAFCLRLARTIGNMKNTIIPAPVSDTPSIEIDTLPRRLTLTGRAVDHHRPPSLMRRHDRKQQPTAMSRAEDLLSGAGTYQSTI